MNRSLALALAISLLAGPGTAGQDPSTGVQESAEVVLVEVPVRVAGRDGMPIRNLTAADFQVFDNGKKQEIVGFDAIDLAEKIPNSTGESIDPAGRRRFLFLFDLTYTRPRGLLEARGAAKEFVLNGMGDADLAAVATFSIETGIRLIATFSSDRLQLARAIDTLGLTPTLSKEPDPLELVHDQQMLQALSVGGVAAKANRPSADGSLIDSLETLRAMTNALDDRYARGRINHIIRSFEDLATVLDVLAGRKDIIYLSEGFESRLLVGTKETTQEREWITTGQIWNIDSDKRFGSSALQNQLEIMSALFRRSDCVIHAVDIGGIRSDAEISTIEPTRVDNSLFEFANGTGGEVFRNENDFRKGLAELLHRTNLVYVLAFRPNRLSGKGEFHELKVKVRTSGARVSARAGYYEKKAFKVLSPLERGLLAADIIANEIPVSQVPARVLASPLPDARGPARVPVLVEASGPELLLAQSGSSLPVEMYVYAYDDEGRLRDFFTQGVSIDLTVNRERLERGGLRYYGQLTLPPGQYRVRALIRNGETGRMGFVAETVRVPDFSVREPYLAPPVFLASSAEGVFVRGRLGAVGRSMAAELILPPAGSRGLMPVALPEVRSGNPSQVSLVAYYFGPHQPQSLKIGAQVLSDEGRPLKDGALQLVSQSSAEPDGKQVLVVAFTPETLLPGRYSLRVFLQDPATGKAGYASAPFLVR
ncbi:MAG TPA: VWA domain-containing protein [Thermoanaerobaculia bacterium]|nr:VWA domain-containing protein [Thermoanaerobaculia bacterium]